MNNIKVIFLDVDGVLNYHGSNSEFDQICLDNLSKIVNTTKCKIVISSTYKLSQISFDRLWNEFEKFNIPKSTYSLENFYYTPDLCDNGFDRTDEILQSLVNIQNYYNIISWVAIDDANLLENNNEILKKHFYKINSKYGLTETDSKNIIDLL